MKLTLLNDSGHPFPDPLVALVEQVAKLSLAHEGVGNLNAMVDVTVVNNQAIKTINAQYREKDVVTDVLSFPMINFELGEKIPPSDAYFLGDIIFSIEMAQAQALEYAHSLEREIGFFIAHSMLHLMGYDHQTPEDEAQMLEKQTAILTAAALPR